MSKTMTKAMLLEENIKLRHNMNLLEDRVASMQAEIGARQADDDSAPTELIAHLQRRGMPRFHQFGREVMPTPKQLAYWQQRVGGTH